MTDSMETPRPLEIQIEEKSIYAPLMESLQKPLNTFRSIAENGSVVHKNGAEFSDIAIVDEDDNSNFDEEEWTPSGVRVSFDLKGVGEIGKTFFVADIDDEVYEKYSRAYNAHLRIPRGDMSPTAPAYYRERAQNAWKAVNTMHNEAAQSLIDSAIPQGIELDKDASRLLFSILYSIHTNVNAINSQEVVLDQPDHQKYDKRVMLSFSDRFRDIPSDKLEALYDEIKHKYGVTLSPPQEITSGAHRGADYQTTMYYLKSDIPLAESRREIQALIQSEIENNSDN